MLLPYSTAINQSSQVEPKHRDLIEKEEKKEDSTRIAQVVETPLLNLHFNTEHLTRSGSIRTIPKLKKNKERANTALIQNTSLTPRKLRCNSTKIIKRKEQNIDQILTLKTQVYTLEAWRGHFYILLEPFILKRLRKNKTNPTKGLKKFINHQGVASTSIHNRIREALEDKIDCPCMEKFLSIHDPTLFLEHYHDLKGGEKTLFKKIIGGPIPLKCLRQCKEEILIKEWSRFAKKIKTLNETIPHIHSKAIPIPPHFDKDFPISNIAPANIANSFRYYYAPDHVSSAPFLEVNGKLFSCPELGNDLKLRERVFIQWLTQVLNKKIHGTNKNLTDQIELFFRPSFCEGEIGAITTKLKELYERQGKNEKHFESHLEEGLTADGIPDAFPPWAKKNLKKFQFMKPELDTKEIVSQFIHDYKIKECAKKIPCFRLLQALSFNAFYPVPKILEREFPNLRSKSPSVLRLKSVPTNPTTYRISIDQNQHIYKVTHIKKHEFVKGLSSQFTSYGSMDVLWTIQGSFHSTLFSGTLNFENLELSKKYPIDLRLQVLADLNLMD